MNADKLTESSLFSRRELMKYGALLGASFGGLTAAGSPAPPPGRASEKQSLARSPRRYDMKSSINMWAFPYPGRMSLRECLELARRAGFDAVELNYNLEGDLSPASGETEYSAIRKMAEEEAD